MANERDRKLESAPAEVETPRGKERIEQSFDTVNEFWNARQEYDRLFALAVGSGANAQVYTFRYLTVRASNEGDVAMFYAADKNGIGIGQRTVIPAADIEWIVMLAERVPYAIEPHHLPDYSGQCAVAEFSHDYAPNVPQFPLHGIIDVQGIDDNRFGSTDHDYEGAQAGAGYHIPAYAIHKVTLCPHARESSKG